MANANYQVTFHEVATQLSGCRVDINMSPTQWSPSLPSLQDLTLTPNISNSKSLTKYLETLSLVCTSAANDRSQDSLVESFYSPRIKSHLETADTWITGPTAHTNLKKQTLTNAGVRVDPLSASATLCEPNVVAESGRGRKTAWGESRFATVFVVTVVSKPGGITTESVTVLHWEKMRTDEGGERWLMSGYEGMRGRANDFGAG